MSLIRRLQQYIDAELSDERLYKELSAMAPNDEYKNMLIGIANDEAKHAQTFLMIYKTITGKDYLPNVMKPDLRGSFNDIVADRVLDESADYLKYGEQYLNTNELRLKRAYYNARSDENVHAHKLLYMLSKK